MFSGTDDEYAQMLEEQEAKSFAGRSSGCWNKRWTVSAWTRITTEYQTLRMYYGAPLRQECNDGNMIIFLYSSIKICMHI